MPSPLSRYFADKALQRVIPHLKPGFQNLVRSLAGVLGDDGRVRVADLFGALFPASTTASANAALNRLIATVNEAARANGQPLTIAITADKKAGAAKRWVWCEGEGEGPVPYTNDLESVRPELRQTGQRAVAVGAPAVLMTFNPHETRAVWDRFGMPAETDSTGAFPVSHLGLHGGMEVWHLVSDQGSGEAGVAARYAISRFKPWAVIAVGIAFGMNPAKQAIGDVLVSNHIRDYQLGRRNPDGSFTPRSGKPRGSDRLLRRIKRLDHQRANTADWPTLHIGTLMCGDELLDNHAHRDKLTAIEPEAVGGEMEASGIEIVCRQDKLDWIVVKGISDWADGAKNSGRKEQDQRLAADNAALVVKAMLDMGPFAPADPPPARPLPAQPAPQLPDRGNIPDGHYQRCVRGRTVSLQRDALDHIQSTEPDEDDPGIDVLPALHEWAEDDEAPPLMALLAEYGMGKTIICQQFTAELDTARKADSRRPMPLYFDLRHVTRRQGRVPTLAEALTECMERGWLDRGDGRSHGMEQIHDWIAQGAVVIIDGLDEVLVKFDGPDGQVFTNNLLKLFADTRARAQADGKPRRLKMLIACRTAYFPNLRAQQTHFTQQDRGEVDAGHYRALLLLPWTEEQITRYLDAALPGTDSAQVLDLIRSVHNLEELAARPFTLRLVAGFIPAIEQQRALGRPVQGVTLYRAMAQRWLERDQGKHHILPEHKMRLAAYLAAYLWRAGRNALPFDDLQGWFHQWRDSQPDLRRYTAIHPDQLEEDLRTATFLVRRDEGKESAFHFAHTSLFEFFLAEHLFAALRANRPDDWAMPVPSAETLDFLGQMLAEAGGGPPLRTLEAWCRPRRAGVGELLLAYALRARTRGWPVPALTGIDLTGADLRGWRIGDGTRPLALDGAVLVGCDLRETAFTDVTLPRADLRGARLDRATLIDADLTGAGFETSHLTGTVFRRCRLDGTRWTGAEGYRTQYHLCHAGGKAAEAGVLGLPAEEMRTPLFAPTVSPAIGASQTNLAWLAGYTSGINACAWSPDGTKIASVGDDGTLRLWDAVTSEAIATLAGHTDRITACTWSLDGTTIASAGDNGTLRLWDAHTGKVFSIIDDHTGPSTACAWVPDGSKIASAGYDGILRLRNVNTGEVLTTLAGHIGPILACAWSPDGLRVASAGYDKTLRLWDAITGEALAIIGGHKEWISGCAWSPDGLKIASVGYDKTLRLWDAAAGEALTIIDDHKEWIRAYAWSPDSTKIVNGGRGQTLHLWDANTGEALTTLTGHTGAVTACAWSPDGTKIASTGGDETLRLWDAATGEALAIISGREQWIRDCAWSPDGTRIASAGDDQILHLWDAATGEALATLTGHTDEINACAWSPDGTRIASGGYDQTLRLWDTVTSETLIIITSHKEQVSNCAWSPDGSKIASAGDDQTLRLWDTTTGEALAIIDVHEGWIRACAWSPDGSKIASAGKNGTLRLWDAGTGEVLATLDGHKELVSNCAWSPDGSKIASAGHDQALRLWDAATGQAIATITGHTGWIFACAWSPDGAKIASAGYDGTLRLWDAATCEAITTLTGHTDSIFACTWSPNGATIASAGGDGTLRLWDANTGELLRVHATWRGGDGRPGFAVWAPSANRVIAASDDAWRSLGWQGLGADGRITRLPLETFGPVPIR